MYFADIYSSIAIFALLILLLFVVDLLLVGIWLNRYFH